MEHMRSSKARIIRVHDLKTWPAPFAEVWTGAKKHEVRQNDRGFAVGDFLLLREYDPGDGKYLDGRFTDRAVFARVTYVTEGGTWGLPSNVCVMSIDAVDTADKYRIGYFDGHVSEARSS